MTTNTNKSRASHALREWAGQNEISPAGLEKATGYSYQHCWNLLNGKVLPTNDTVARLLAAYGAEAAQLISDALNGAAADQEKA